MGGRVRGSPPVHLGRAPPVVLSSLPRPPRQPRRSPGGAAPGEGAPLSQHGPPSPGPPSEYSLVILSIQFGDLLVLFLNGGG